MLGDARVQMEDFDVADEIAKVARTSDDVGAIASFIGVCRAEGGSLEGIEIEVYPAMARTEMERILQAASARWPLHAISVVHRYGRIAVGHQIVLVVVAAGHRGDAFAAAEFIMDFLKQAAPFWKRGLTVDGEASWVGANRADAVAAGRWNEDGICLAAMNKQQARRSKRPSSGGRAGPRRGA
jgi:molybdopterin synthase catalytic subunit